MADVFKFDAYLTFVDRMISQNGMFTDPPAKPLGQIVKAGDKYFIEIRKTTLQFVDGYRLKYSEYGEIDDKNKIYEIKKYSYHFEGRDQGLHAFRVDRDIDERPHANHQKYRPGWPHRLFYPEDTKLDITSMGIPLFINMGQLYINTEEYPLLNEYAERYNESNEIIRREII